ncbi:MAG: hypothetical protein WB770_06855 [Acidimicrobiales bacterium]
MAMIRTKRLELRKRRGMMIVVGLLTIGLPVLFLGLRLLFHAIDPKSYGPAGSPGVFQSLIDPTAEFGFIIAATVGATLGATDLSEGVFRQLVITGRSRVALYLARVPAGLTILIPLIAIGFTMNCLVVSFAGTAQPKAVNMNGVSIPLHLNEHQFETWRADHPRQVSNAFGGGGFFVRNGKAHPVPATSLSNEYSTYSSTEIAQLNPPINEMVKIGLWLELVIATGFLFGLGLGSLTGQRTISTILMIVLQIIVTPILAAHVIPYFINGQRLVVGVALTQLRPAGLAGPFTGNQGGPGHAIFGGRASLGIPPMPTWAMVAVIVGWIVGWTVIGAWRMQTRDA